MRLPTRMVAFIAGAELLRATFTATAQEATPELRKGDFAATETQPQLPPVPQGSYIGTTRPQWNVFVIGDLLAEGIWGGLSRLSEGNDRLALSLRMKEESGLARPGVYDWVSAVDRIAESNTVDVAVVMLGSNDGQDMQSEAGPIPFGSPEWQTAYAEAVDALLAVMKLRGVAVYWLGVPPNGNPERDAALKLVNRIQKERATANGVRFIDLRTLFTSDRDSFIDTFPDEQGNIVRMRMRDGVRMLKAGNTRAALAILPVIDADIRTADADVQASAPVVEQTPGIEASPDPSGPRFGGGGEREDWTAASPPKPAVPSIVRSDRLDEREIEQRRIVTDFTEKSILPPPKPGRIDDFSYTPPAAN